MLSSRRNEPGFRALTRYKIISHGQDHHRDSEQDKNSWLLTPRSAGPLLDFRVHRARRSGATPERPSVMASCIRWAQVGPNFGSPTHRPPAAPAWKHGASSRHTVRVIFGLRPRMTVSARYCLSRIAGEQHATLLTLRCERRA